MTLTEKISNLVSRNIYFSDWKRVQETGGDGLLSCGVLHYKVFTKGGRWIIVQAAVSVIISGLELMKNQKTSMRKALLQEKYSMGRFSLCEFIEQQFRRRTGLKGHRGWFRLVDISSIDGRYGSN